MGRMYKQLKEALKSNPVRDLLIVDDTSVRLKLFQQAEAIIKKIDKLDRERDSFFEQDQRLYHDWFELTFREEIAKHQRLLEEYKSLAIFHNSIIAASEMLDIPVYEAYAMLKDEEERFQNGNAQERAEIEKNRQERADFAERAMKEEFGSGFDDFFDDEDESAKSLFDEEVDLSNLTKNEKMMYDDLKRMSTEEIRQCMSDRDAIYKLLNAFAVTSKAWDMDLFLRIWDSTPEKVRRQASRSFKQETGEAMEDIVEEIRFAKEQEDFEEEELSGISDTGETAQFINLKKEGYQDLSQKDEQNLKQTFRKLARMIHPDSQDAKVSSSLKQWYSKIWMRVQEAYKGRDLHTLKRLEILAIIRLKDLQSLSLDEIANSTQWLEEEFDELQGSLSEIKKHPAWKFSTKRSYETLKIKISKELSRNMEPLIEDIEGIRDTHKSYELFAGVVVKQRQASKKSSRGLKKKKKKSRSRPSI